MLIVAITLLVSGEIDGRALRYAVIVTFPDDVRVRWEGQQPLDRLPIDLISVAPGVKMSRDLPNLDVSSTINPGPDTQDILTTPYTQHSSADLFTGLGELVANNR